MTLCDYIIDKPEEAKAKITAQERGYWQGLNDFYEKDDASNLEIFTHKVSGLSDDDFTLPFPEVDLSLNPGLMDEPVDFDFSSIGY